MGTQSPEDRLLSQSEVGRIAVGDLAIGERLRDRVERLRRGRPSAEELAVARALLRGPDARHESLLRQFEMTREIVRRRPRTDAWALIVGYVPESLTFTLDVDEVISEPLTTRDLRTGVALTFRAFVLRHGVLSHLEGRTGDGSAWPATWSISADIADHVPVPMLKLPSIEDIRQREAQQRTRLAEWLSVQPFELAAAATHEPASPEELAALGQREDALLPREYAALLAITDGIEIGELTVAGTSAAYRLDIPNTDRVVIAWVHGETDDAVLTLARNGADETVYRIDIHDPDVKSHPVASGTQELIRHVLRNGLQAVIASLPVPPPEEVVGR
jgi:hypothetical protein